MKFETRTTTVRISRQWLAAALLPCAVLAGSATAHSEGKQWFGLVDVQPLRQTWVNAGFASYHFQRDQNLNGANGGIGIEQRLSSVTALTAGRFHNSDRVASTYVGAYYQPLALGPFRVGGVFGGFNGYSKMRDGGWFLAAIPVVSVEYRAFGLNLAVVPKYKDRLYGAISFQAKLKVFE